MRTVELIDGTPLRRGLSAFAAGALTVLAFAPFGFGVAAILGPALLLTVLRATRPREAFWLGWLWGLGLLGFGVFWLRVSIIQFGGVNLPLALFITLGFAALMALYYGLAAWSVARLGASEHAWITFVAFPSAWVLGEWLRGWVLSGFPWLALGYSQLDTPLSGLAPVLGVYGVSLVVVVSASLVVAWRSGWPLAVLAVLWLGAGALKPVAWSEPAGARFEVSVIQGNIAQALKWRPDQFVPTLRLYNDLTEQAGDSRLIVWPETAVPAYAHQVEAQVLAPLADAASARGQDLLFGIPVLEADDRYYNAVMNLGLSGKGVYYKRHLVPFGEFMPLNAVLAPLIEILAIPMSEFSSGSQPAPLLTTAGYPAAMSVCYEDAFGNETVQALPDAAFLVNVSNDAWFGDSLAPHQHLEIARMRALETRRYMVRATNTGISAIIAPSGELQRVAPQFQQTVLTGEIEPRQGATPFVRVGNYAVILICAALLALVYWRRRRF